MAAQQPTDRQFRYLNRPIRCSTQLSRYYGRYHEQTRLYINVLIARRTNRDHHILTPGVGTYFILHDNSIPSDGRCQKRTLDLWRTQVNFPLIPGGNLIPSIIYIEWSAAA